MKFTQCFKLSIDAKHISCFKEVFLTLLKIFRNVKVKLSKQLSTH